MSPPYAVPLTLALCVAGAAQADANLFTTNGPLAIPVRSWKTLRDSRIVKQDRDYSCGAASLATILNEFYGQSITEQALLAVLDKGDARASFDDMARILPQFGFRGRGYAASFEQLVRLRIPVVVYLRHRKDEHFSVVRGIDTRTVWLADPSLGNRLLSREQFLEMWETRDDPLLKGRLLAILPADSTMRSSTDFFSTKVSRPTDQAISLLPYRTF